MLTYKIHLIRSGSVSGANETAVLGEQNLPLSNNSKELFKELLKNFRYPYPDKVYTSPLRQCIETAQIIYPDNKPIINDKLLDMDLGEFEGKTYDELIEDELFKKWIKDSVNNIPPYGESMDEFVERVMEVADMMFSDMMKEEIYDIAVVANSGFIMTLLSSLGLPREPMDRWQTENGVGFTIMTSVQMWMRDRAFEIIGNIPLLD